jgi:iron complex outermembrane receptor protein
MVDESNEVTVKDTDIILSPAFVGSFQLNWNPFKNFQASWLSKVVSHQYLDNSQNESLALDDYFINDVRLTWHLPLSDAKQLEFGALVNNVLDATYSSNGYAYDGVPYFFPQAGRNFMFMVTIKF